MSEVPGGMVEVHRMVGKVLYVETRLVKARVYMAGDTAGSMWDTIVVLGSGKYYGALHFGVDGSLHASAKTLMHTLGALLAGHAVGRVEVRDDEVYFAYVDPFQLYYFKVADAVFMKICDMVYELGGRADAMRNAEALFAPTPERVKLVKEFLEALP